MKLVCPSCATKNRVPDTRLREDPLCGKCGAPLLSPEPVALNDESFNRFIEGTELPVVVDYWAAWCGPCKTMAPQFAAAAAQMPEVRFAKVDTEASPAVSMRHRIRSIPTMVLFRGGEEIARRSGALRAGDIISWVRGQLR
jgi:thioredoxin 2